MRASGKYQLAKIVAMEPVNPVLLRRQRMLFMQRWIIADWAISAQLADLSRALDKTTLVRAAPWDLETR